MIVDSKALDEGNLRHLRLRIAPCEPPIEHAAVKQVLDPPHGNEPLLLFALVVIRRDEGPAAAGPGAEKRALLHQLENPVPRSEVVAIEQQAERGAEGRRLLRELGRVVVETGKGLEKGGGGGEGGGGEVAGDDCGAAYGGRIAIHNDEGGLEEKAGGGLKWDRNGCAWEVKRCITFVGRCGRASCAARATGGQNLI